MSTVSQGKVAALNRCGVVGNYKYLSMAYTLSNKCAKNLCKRTVLSQLIIKNVVTCFLRHSVYNTNCGPENVTLFIVLQFLQMWTNIYTIWPTVYWVNMQLNDTYCCYINSRKQVNCIVITLALLLVGLLLVSAASPSMDHEHGTVCQPILEHQIQLCALSSVTSRHTCFSSSLRCCWLVAQHRSSGAVVTV